MDAVEYLIKREKMCEIPCSECGFNYDNNGEQIHCEEFERMYPEKAVKMPLHSTQTRATQMQIGLQIGSVDVSRALNAAKNTGARRWSDECRYSPSGDWTLCPYFKGAKK